jgi:hypothetical protein
MIVMLFRLDRFTIQITLIKQKLIMSSHKISTPSLFLQIFMSVLKLRHNAHRVTKSILLGKR